MIDERLSVDQMNALQVSSRDMNGAIYIKGTGFSKEILFLSIRDFHLQYPEELISYVSESHLKINNLKRYCENYEIDNVSFYNHLEIIQLIKSKNAFNVIFCDDAEDLPKSIIVKLISNSNKTVLKSNGISQFVKHPIWNERPASISEIQEIKSVKIIELNDFWNLKNDIFNLIQRGLQLNFVLSKKVGFSHENAKVNLYGLNNHVDEVIFCWERAIEIKSKRYSERVGIILPNNKLLFIFINTLLNSDNKPTFSETQLGIDFSVLNDHLRLNSIDALIIGSKPVENSRNDESNKIIFSTYSEFRNFDFDYVLLPFLGFDRPFDDRLINHKKLFSNVLFSFLSVDGIDAFYSGALNSEITDFFEGNKIQFNLNDDENNNDITF